MNEDIPHWRNKIDHSLRALWERTPEPERANYDVRVLLKFSGSVQRLEKLGFKAGSVAGDITYGTIVLGDLPQIASALEVVFIELAQSLLHDP